jgi:hypothetical protein
MQDAFAIVLVVVLVGAVVGAVWAGFASRDPYGRIGRGALSLNEDGDAHGRRPAQAAAVLAAEREAEIRQLLAARNVRRAARGLEAIDVEGELRQLLDSARTGLDGFHDPALVDEVRQLVVARNARRQRAGKPPLDVDQEVARQLRDLT